MGVWEEVSTLQGPKSKANLWEVGWERSACRRRASRGRWEVGMQNWMDPCPPQ